jgi:hypothetical protein
VYVGLFTEVLPINALIKSVTIRRQTHSDLTYILLIVSTTRWLGETEWKYGIDERIVGCLACPRRKSAPHFEEHSSHCSCSSYLGSWTQHAYLFYGSLSWLVRKWIYSRYGPSAFPTRKEIDVIESKIKSFHKFVSPRGTFCVLTIFFYYWQFGETGWDGERSKWTDVGKLAMDYWKGHESLQPNFTEQKLV